MGGGSGTFDGSGGVGRDGGGNNAIKSRAGMGFEFDLFRAKSAGTSRAALAALAAVRIEETADAALAARPQRCELEARIVSASVSTARERTSAQRAGRSDWDGAAAFCTLRPRRRRCTNCRCVYPHCEVHTLRTDLSRWWARWWSSHARRSKAEHGVQARLVLRHGLAVVWEVPAPRPRGLSDAQYSVLFLRMTQLGASRRLVQLRQLVLLALLLSTHQHAGSVAGQ